MNSDLYMHCSANMYRQYCFVRIEPYIIKLVKNKLQMTHYRQPGITSAKFRGLNLTYLYTHLNIRNRPSSALELLACFDSPIKLTSIASYTLEMQRCI